MAPRFRAAYTVNGMRRWVIRGCVVLGVFVAAFVVFNAVAPPHAPAKIKALHDTY